MVQFRTIKNRNLKVAVIGGGTGSFTLLTALKEFTEDIAALVNMADDGGSTGILRDELGVLPPGDIRQCLVALSKAPEIRDLFDYRFEEGAMKGHAFGNLFLTALEKMTGNFAGGVELASEILDIVGVVEPITLSNVKLVMEDENGNEVIGQHKIEASDFKTLKKPKLWLEPMAEVNTKAIVAIRQADIVIIAPGNLYATLAPALIVPGIGRALRETKASKIYVCNLVTKPGQTDGYSVVDFADEIERLAGYKFLDAVLFNKQRPTKTLLDKYAKDGEKVVEYDKTKAPGGHYGIIGANLLSKKIWIGKSKSDILAKDRTLIRHDPKQTVKALLEIHRHIGGGTKI